MPGQHMSAQAKPASLSVHFEPLQSCRPLQLQCFLELPHQPLTEQQANSPAGSVLKGWSERHVPRRYSGTHLVSILWRIVLVFNTKPLDEVISGILGNSKLPLLVLWVRTPQVCRLEVGPQERNAPAKHQTSQNSLRVSAHCAEVMSNDSMMCLCQCSSLPFSLPSKPLH